MKGRLAIYVLALFLDGLGAWRRCALVLRMSKILNVFLRFVNDIRVGFLAFSSVLTCGGLLEALHETSMLLRTGRG